MCGDEAAKCSSRHSRLAVQNAVLGMRKRAKANACGFVAAEVTHALGVLRKETRKQQYQQ